MLPAAQGNGKAGDFYSCRRDRRRRINNPAPAARDRAAVVGSGRVGRGKLSPSRRKNLRGQRISRHAGNGDGVAVVLGKQDQIGKPDRSRWLVGEVGGAAQSLPVNPNCCARTTRSEKPTVPSRLASPAMV